MAPFGSGHTVLDGNSTPDSPKGATMSRIGVLIAMAAIALMAASCAGEEDRAPAEPVEAGPESADTAFDPEVGAGPVDPAASEADLRRDIAADATPVRLGERFAWCLTVQAMWDDQDLYRAEAEAAAAAHRTAVDTYEAATDDLDRAEAHEAAEEALGEYRFVSGVYGRVRWKSAGLIVGDESSLQAGDREDATLQVARERAVEAFRAGAAADTLEAIDLAYEATETAAHLSAAALSDATDESDQPVPEAPDSGAAPFEASEGWIVATEALQDVVEAAEEAEDARKAASAAVRAARAAVGDAEGSATAIYEAAHADGNWEAMITDVRRNPHDNSTIGRRDPTLGIL